MHSGTLSLKSRQISKFFTTNSEDIAKGIAEKYGADIVYISRQRFNDLIEVMMFAAKPGFNAQNQDLRGEKKKVEEARAKGYSDPASEAQIKVIEAVLTEHLALYEKVSGLQDAEQGKEFELPVQGTDLSRFQPMDIGGYDKFAVRYGRGPELAKPEDIEKLVDLKKITAYYGAMKSYAPVVDFMPDTPEEVKNRILFTRDARYEKLAQIAKPLISGAGWEGISSKNYIGPRNISEIRAVVEGSMSESEPVIGMGEPPA